MLLDLDDAGEEGVKGVFYRHVKAIGDHGRRPDLRIVDNLMLHLPEFQS